MLKQFEKWLGYVECEKCKTKFRKDKNTSIGMIGNLNEIKTVYYCKVCSNKILTNAFNSCSKNERRYKNVKKKNKRC